MNCSFIVPFFFLIPALWFSSGCFPGGEKSELVPADSMVLILTDLHIVSGGIQRQARPQQARDQAIHDMYDQVLALRKMDRKRFWQSYAYYLDRPVEFDSIYVQIIENLNKKLPEAEIRARRLREDGIEPPVVPPRKTIGSGF